MDLRCLIAFLISSVQKGSRGSRVTDYRNYKGTIADPSLLHVYEMEIDVIRKNSGPPEEQDVLVLNLSKVWPERNYKDPSYHAVCIQYLKQREDG